MSKNSQKIAFLVLLYRKSGFDQKLKVPKWVCRSTLASACNEPTLFAIFGPASGQIFGKKVEKVLKNQWMFAFFGRANARVNWEDVSSSQLLDEFSVLTPAARDAQCAGLKRPGQDFFIFFVDSANLIVFCYFNIAQKSRDPVGR